MNTPDNHDGHTISLKPAGAATDPTIDGEAPQRPVEASKAPEQLQTGGEAENGTEAVTPTQTVYVVTVGEYSDYRIRAIFANKADAEQYIATENSERTYPEFNEIEEHEMYLTMPTREIIWQADVQVGAGAVAPDRITSSVAWAAPPSAQAWPWRQLSGATIWRGNATAPTAEQARKAAYDAIARAKAEQEGIA